MQVIDHFESLKIGDIVSVIGDIRKGALEFVANDKRMCVYQSDKISTANEWVPYIELSNNSCIEIL